MRPISLKPTMRLFFIATFAVSWLIWIPLAVSHLQSTPFIPEGTGNIIRLLGVLAPAIVAILLASLDQRPKGVGVLLGRLKIWNVGCRWWAVAALVQPVLLILVALTYTAFGGSPRLPWNSQLNAIELLGQTVLLAIATLGEEIGWRGYALPALLKKYSPVRASLLLGFIWSVWHIPFWLLQDSYDQFGPGYMALNFLMIVPMSLFITWFFMHSGESILLAAAFHLTFNIINVAVVPVTSLIVPYVLFIILQWGIAGWVVWSDRLTFRSGQNYGADGITS